MTDKPAPCYPCLIAFLTGSVGEDSQSCGAEGGSKARVSGFRVRSVTEVKKTCIRGTSAHTHRRTHTAFAVPKSSEVVASFQLCPSHVNFNASVTWRLISPESRHTDTGDPATANTDSDTGQADQESQAPGRVRGVTR